MNAIEALSLTKRYGSLTAVDGLTFSVACGELYSLLGVNGAGKTTTVKMLSCLSIPAEGDALIFGKSIISNAADVKRMIAVSPQETAVGANLTVRENLEMMSSICGCSSKAARENARRIAAQLALGDVMNKRASKLSGGYKRRLSIAMALICEPKLLFLDEPTLALDVLARRELWKLIRSLKGKMTIMMTTHYMEEAEALSDKIGVMKDGRMIFSGTADEMKHTAGTENFEDAFVTLAERTSDVPSGEPDEKGGLR